MSKSLKRILATSLLSCAILVGGTYLNNNKPAFASQPPRVNMRLNNRDAKAYYAYENTNQTYSDSKMPYKPTKMPRSLRHRGAKLRVLDPGYLTRTIHHQKYYYADEYGGFKKRNKHSYYMGLFVNSKDFYRLRHGSPYTNMINKQKRQHNHLKSWLHRHPTAPKGYFYIVGRGKKVPAINDVDVGYTTGNEDDSTEEGYSYDNSPLNTARYDVYNSDWASSFGSRNDLKDFEYAKIKGTLRYHGYKFDKVEIDGVPYWINAGSLSTNIFKKGSSHLANVHKVLGNLVEHLNGTSPNSNLNLRKFFSED